MKSLASRVVSITSCSPTSQVPSDPNTKSEEFLWVGARSTLVGAFLFQFFFLFSFVFFCFCFCFCFCLFLFLFVRGNVYSVRMLEKITLQGQSVAIRIRQKCQYFQANHKKTQKRIKWINFRIINNKKLWELQLTSFLINALEQARRHANSCIRQIDIVRPYGNFSVKERT